MQGRGATQLKCKRGGSRPRPPTVGGGELAAVWLNHTSRPAACAATACACRVQACSGCKPLGGVCNAARLGQKVDFSRGSLARSLGREWAAAPRPAPPPGGAAAGQPATAAQTHNTSSRWRRRGSSRTSCRSLFGCCKPSLRGLRPQHRIPATHKQQSLRKDKVQQRHSALRQQRHSTSGQQRHSTSRQPGHPGSHLPFRRSGNQGRFPPAPWQGTDCSSGSVRACVAHTQADGTPVP